MENEKHTNNEPILNNSTTSLDSLKEINKTASNDLKSENVIIQTPIQASSSSYIMSNTMLPFIDENEDDEENESNDTVVEVVVETGEIPTVSGSVEMASKCENVHLQRDLKFHKKLINETKKSVFFKEKQTRGLASM